MLWFKTNHDSCPFCRGEILPLNAWKRNGNKGSANPSPYLPRMLPKLTQHNTYVACPHYAHSSGPNSTLEHNLIFVIIDMMNNSKIQPSLLQEYLALL